MDRKWDIRFLKRAKDDSMWSKDPSTQVGAIIVRPDKTIASTGFNGFPMKMPDHDAYYLDRDEKYSRIIHGEMNALIFSRDATIEGYTLYTWPFLPCSNCFNHMIQAGIIRFVAPECPHHLKERWEDDFTKVKQHADEMNRNGHDIIIDEYPIEEIDELYYERF